MFPEGQLIMLSSLQTCPTNVTIVKGLEPVAWVNFNALFVPLNPIPVYHTRLTVVIVSSDCAHNLRTLQVSMKTC